MARQRSRGSSSNQVSSAGVGNETPGTDNSVSAGNNNKGEKTMAGALSLEEVNAILASGRTRGGYAEFLIEFIESGEPGLNVDLKSGQLSGKTVDQAFTGFSNARKAMNSDGTAKVPGGSKIKVLRNKDKTEVYLINTEHVQTT